MPMTLLKSLFTCIIGLFLGWVLLSCSEANDKDDVNEIKTPKLLSWKFTKELNPFQISETANCKIVDDSVLICWVRNIMPNKILKASFEFEGDNITIDGTEAHSGVTEFDYKAPVRIGIHYGSFVKYYSLYVYSFTGLPVVWIDTENRNEIISKSEYIRANFRLEENVVTRGPGDTFVDSVNIKGRGNSTWNAPKRPYALKFDKKVSLLGEEKDKSWVLLANYYDLTMLRNQTAFYMSQISDLDYTPKSHFVEVMLNGRYNGTYQLCEKLKIAKHRVDVGDDGFLMEIDGRAVVEEEPYFYINHLPFPVNIKDPDVIVDDSNFVFAKKYIELADSVLFSENFKDPVNGWQKYMDLKSFVDFFLINEIAKNGDVCIMYTSCYMNLKRGGILKMGPIWDFDNSFGKHQDPNMWPVEGWYFKNSVWYSRLFEDPSFVNEVKKRFAFFYEKRYDIMRNINVYSEYLKYAVMENNRKWNTLYNPNVDFNINIWGSYTNEVQYLKTWLNSRFEWLNAEISNL